MASKVYYLSDRAVSTAGSLPFKAVKVLRDAGLESMIQKGDKVGIKTHMGEWGAAFNLRPHWIGAIADEVKRLGGEPSVIECLTAPYGEVCSRATKADHLRTAVTHGFTEEVIGCPIVICDGDYGFDDVRVEVPRGLYLKAAYIGKGVLDFDKIIVVSHFKGHGMGVFGGALKNVGIGMASGRGKVAIHSMTHPQYGTKGWTINEETVAQMNAQPRPNRLDRLVNSCPHGVYSYDGTAFTQDKSRCKSCGYCFAYYGSGIFNIPALHLPNFPAAFTDAASGFIHAIGKDNCIFVNYAVDITPGCDCQSFHDRAMIPNIGVFASRDPVALDMACVEAAEDQVAVPGSLADDAGYADPHTERFTHCCTPSQMSQWEQLNSGVYNGLGTTEYTLITSKDGDDADFYFGSYDMTNTTLITNKAAFARYDGTTEDCYLDYAHPALTLEQQAQKPKGKVGEMTIDADK